MRTALPARARRGVLPVTAVIIALALQHVTGATASPRTGSPVPPPDGLNAQLVFTSDGWVTMDDMMAHADWFHRDIMGRDDAALAAERAAARAYFVEQFGLDTEPMAFGLTPAMEYRAYSISGEAVPPEGWVVRDGGFVVMLDPDEPTVLHGAWGGVDGKEVPPGSFVVWGEYNVQRPGPGRSPDRAPIVIDYRSEEPMMIDAFGNSPIVCALVSDQWGQGTAAGLIKYVPEVVDGVHGIRIHTANVLQFPAS